MHVVLFSVTANVPGKGEIEQREGKGRQERFSELDV